MANESVKSVEAETSVDDGEPAVTTASAPQEYAIEDLLDRITPDNVHPEISTGLPVGDEIW